MESTTLQQDPVTPPHPRVLGWVGTAALAMGGSNQMIFLITALFVGQGVVLMWPNRVGGISAACAEAFRPYNPVLSALTGTCYWWGWVPTCGLTALLSASAFQQWYFPWLPVEAVAIIIVCFFSFVNLCGIKWVARLAIPIATASASLAFVSALTPMLAGDVNWTQAFDYHLTTPFEGWFGELTSIMAGLYLIAEPLGHDLAMVLGPTFAPLFGSFGKAAAIWFVMFNMFHGTLQPLRRRPHAVATQRRRAPSPFPVMAHRGNGLPVDGDVADRRLGHHLPVGWRSGVDDRRRQLHLPHRHLHAEHRGLAAPPRPAQR
jgi:hypothetical protein